MLCPVDNTNVLLLATHAALSCCDAPSKHGDALPSLVQPHIVSVMWPCCSWSTVVPYQSSHNELCLWSAVQRMTRRKSVCSRSKGSRTPFWICCIREPAHSQCQDPVVSGFIGVGPCAGVTQPVEYIVCSPVLQHSSERVDALCLTVALVLVIVLCMYYWKTGKYIA
jgi:hypothetical protein